VSAERPRLAELAERLGIAASYWDLVGNARPSSDATREALVGAMGFDASDEAAAERTLEALARADAERLVDPVLVWREYDDVAPSLPLNLAGATASCDYEIEVRTEDGALHRARGRVDPETRWIALPLRPRAGYHDVQLRVGAAEGVREGRQRFIMAPRTAYTTRERIGDARVFGLWTNLYSVRSAQNQGFGDFGDLAALLRHCASIGGAFVGVNPLHAIPNRGLAITPYSPSSRLYRNVLYLDVEAVPEWSASPAARARLADSGRAARLAALRAADAIDHGAVLDAKLPVLADLFATFRAQRAAGSNARSIAFAAFVEIEGQRLRDFATWEVLAAHFAERPDRPATAWRRWPLAYRRADGAEVAAFRDAHATEIEYRMWLQFELAEQLARAAAAGRDAGLAIGLYQDLAVGSAGDSADTWMAPALFAAGASVGAPPDDYAPDGQNWGFPPLDPHALRADGYRFFAAMLRANFASSGALRIDHAMGLLRLFWIPEGQSGSAGTYVRYRHDELFGVLALESRRHAALVIAEDLGTVPDEFRPLLLDWGILSSAVLYFERDGNLPRPAQRISAHALATVETHDLVPLAGFAGGRDIAIRRVVGQIADDAALETALAERRAEYEAWIARLRDEGLLPAEGEVDAVALAGAVHAFLARTPAPLVGVSLDDLAGESEPINVPGVPVEQHRSWSRRMSFDRDAILATPAAKASLAGLASERSSSVGG
jgi:4-alpha-glucanotransferase